MQTAAACIAACSFSVPHASISRGREGRNIPHQARPGLKTRKRTSEGQMHQQMAVPGACSLAAEAPSPVSRINLCCMLGQVLSGMVLGILEGIQQSEFNSPKVFSPLSLSQGNKVAVQV